MPCPAHREHGHGRRRDAGREAADERDPAEQSASATAIIPERRAADPGQLERKRGSEALTATARDPNGRASWVARIGRTSIVGVVPTEVRSVRVSGLGQSRELTPGQHGAYIAVFAGEHRMSDFDVAFELDDGRVVPALHYLRLKPPELRRVRP